MGGSWFNNELFTLGFFIVEGLIVGISWMLVYRDSDKLFADAPPDKAPIRSMFWMFWGEAWKKKKDMFLCCWCFFVFVFFVCLTCFLCVFEMFLDF